MEPEKYNLRSVKNSKLKPSPKSCGFQLSPCLYYYYYYYYYFKW